MVAGTPFKIIIPVLSVLSLIAEGTVSHRNVNPEFSIRRTLSISSSVETRVALIGFWGDGGTSQDQSCDEGAKESFAPAPGVVHELEEAEIQRQLLLRDAPVWPQPGA